jgi:hypothetical protein
MKTFNTEGPINPQDRYYVANRINEKQIQELIDQKKYFVLYAPQQSGKTTSMLASIERLNKEGRYRAFYINVEVARTSHNDINKGTRLILDEMLMAAKTFSPDLYRPFATIVQEELNKTFEPNLRKVLSLWSLASNKPIVLYIDEVSMLKGDMLIYILSQLRTGHTDRPKRFPQSVCLIGVHNVRDYRERSADNQMKSIRGSIFNIVSECLVLPNFSQEQIADLYTQHTKETGQEFTAEAVAYAFYLTQGQPWLVNKLAHEACRLEEKNPITKDIIEQAKDILIARRETRTLLALLQEPRVCTIIDSIISGKGKNALQYDDLEYVRDLGLVSQSDIKIANPIYEEIIPHELAHRIL